MIHSNSPWSSQYLLLMRRHALRGGKVRGWFCWCGSSGRVYSDELKRSVGRPEPMKWTVKLSPPYTLQNLHQPCESVGFRQKLCKHASLTLSTCPDCREREGWWCISLKTETQTTLWGALNTDRLKGTYWLSSHAGCGIRLYTRCSVSTRL